MCIAKLGMQHSWGCRTSWDPKNTMLVVLVAMSSLCLQDQELSALAAAGDAAKDGSTQRGKSGVWLPRAQPGLFLPRIISREFLKRIVCCCGGIFEGDPGAVGT